MRRYTYKEIKSGIYLFDIGSPKVQCVACFRTAPTWRLERLDFGSVPAGVLPKDIHPATVDLEAPIEGIDFRAIYNTLADICLDRIKSPGKIIYLRSDYQPKLRLLRWFVNQNSHRIDGVLDIYAVEDGQQVKFTSETKAEVILLVPATN